MLFRSLDVPIIHRDACGMPSLGLVPSPSPSPKAAAVPPAPPPTLTMAQLIAVIIVPVVLLTLVGRFVARLVELQLAASAASAKVRPV